TPRRSRLVAADGPCPVTGPAPDRVRSSATRTEPDNRHLRSWVGPRLDRASGSGEPPATPLDANRPGPHRPDRAPPPCLTCWKPTRDPPCCVGFPTESTRRLHRPR